VVSVCFRKETRSTRKGIDENVIAGDLPRHGRYGPVRTVAAAVTRLTLQGLEAAPLLLEAPWAWLCAYLTGREPAMRMSTSLLALCCQSGPDATWETPISARSRSNGSRSLRMSRLLIARFTSESIAPWI
jgi:hypothetical protein